MQQVLNWLIGLAVLGALVGVGVGARRIQRPKAIPLPQLPASPDAVVLSALTSITKGLLGSRGWHWTFGTIPEDDDCVALTTVDLRNGAEWLRLTFCTEPPEPVSPERPFPVVLTLEEYSYDARWISLLLLGKLPKRPVLRMRTKLIRALPKAARRAGSRADVAQGTAV